MDTQAFRRSLHHSDRYNRRGFDSPTKRAQALEEAYQSDLISSIRDNDFTYTKGRLNIKLAQALVSVGELKELLQWLMKLEDITQTRIFGSQTK